MFPGLSIYLCLGGTYATYQSSAGTCQRRKVYHDRRDPASSDSAELREDPRDDQF